MKWHEKSRSHDLFFCTNKQCNTVTFRSVFQNLCPSCGEPGTLTRSEQTLRIADRIEEEKRRRESETLKEESQA